MIGNCLKCKNQMRRATYVEAGNYDSWLCTVCQEAWSNLFLHGMVKELIDEIPIGKCGGRHKGNCDIRTPYTGLTTIGKDGLISDTVYHHGSLCLSAKAQKAFDRGQKQFRWR